MNIVNNLKLIKMYVLYRDFLPYKAVDSKSVLTSKSNKNRNTDSSFNLTAPKLTHAFSNDLQVDTPDSFNLSKSGVNVEERKQSYHDVPQSKLGTNDYLDKIDISVRKQDLPEIEVEENNKSNEEEALAEYLSWLDDQQVEHEYSIERSIYNRSLFDHDAYGDVESIPPESPLPTLRHPREAAEATSQPPTPELKSLTGLIKRRDSFD
jgi:hypothetical protein